MARRCNCSGGCCGPQTNDVDRREFLTMIGAGTAAAMAGGSAWADRPQKQLPPEELNRWKKALMQPVPARVYKSGVHNDARMHLGGIGAGNIEIGCDGQFTNWQLFNTLRDGYVPLMFVVKAGGAARLLQTAGGPDWPRVKQIEMTGEYPIAALRYIDSELPIKVELSAFTPFAPLDANFSSQPLAVLSFRIQNPTLEVQTVSLAALMQNPVGYDAVGKIDSTTHDKFGGNVNEPLREGPATGLLMRAESGKEPSLDKPVTIFVGMSLQPMVELPPERPKNFAIWMLMQDAAVDTLKAADPANSIIWLEEPAADFPKNALRLNWGAADHPENAMQAIRKIVEAGATLLFSGKKLPLLEACAEKLLPEEQRKKLPVKESALRNGLKTRTRALGKGKIVVVDGSIIDLGQLESAAARQRAYGTICELAVANYTPPQGVPPSACGSGALALVALGENVTVLPACDDWNVVWEQFKKQGALAPFAEAKPNAPTPSGRTVNGAVAATVKIPGGGSVDVPFLLAWHYPNKYNPGGVWMGCKYATLWPDAKAVVREAAANLSAIRQRTESFRKTFYDSTLPYWMLDCMTSQAATIRHVGVVFRIANGDVYGWEGSNGCCQPTCTHVWGYEQSLARLFPDLEREMRRIDFKHQQRPDGGVNNRTDVPSPPHPTCEGPASDGHASCILKAYREALNCPDDSFLKEYWPNVKKAVEYLVNRDAATSGGTPDGALEDPQPNTYDQELHGVTTFISGYYLAALRAGEEWAKLIGDVQTAQRFHAIFLRGQENLVKRCWNGEYFQQDLPDYLTWVAKTPWGAETGQIGPGCMADQLIGQWWAHQLGLGHILPKEKVQSALRSIFKYNWLTDVAGFKQTPRAFAGDKDKGLLTCSWPKGGRPKAVMLYSDEIWTGIEYQVAAHMIYEGMIEEGLAIVKGARDRYDGVPRPPIGRNPWNELECGGHYARAMSSWSLLLALSGYQYDGVAKGLRFAPRITPEDFKAFFSGPEGWGSLRQVRAGAVQRNEIQVVEGQLAVGQLRLAPPDGARQLRVTLGGASVEAVLKAEADGALATFAAPIIVRAGQTLMVHLR